MENYVHNLDFKARSFNKTLRGFKSLKVAKVLWKNDENIL